MIEQRLQLIREHMMMFDIDAYLVLSRDAHNSEYPPASEMRLEWISGFSGSAGEAIITLDDAYFITDGRYILQASQQLAATQYTLLNNVSLVDWLSQHANGMTVGVDPKMISIKYAGILKSILQQVNGSLKFVDNLVDMHRDYRLTTYPIYRLDDCFSGNSMQDKIKYLNQHLVQSDIDYLVINSLDQIAWLFNLRGQDIEYNPLFISYAIIGKQTKLFVHMTQMPAEIKLWLESANIEVIQYEQFAQELHALRGRVMLNDSAASYWMLLQLSDDTIVVYAASPILIRQAYKNAIEIDGARAAHAQDAIAVIKFLYWLEQAWHDGVDEMSCAKYLDNLRLQRHYSMGNSFATISAFGEHAAIIHYHATNSTNRTIDDTNLYLFDSGGQYLNGTTDITRTIHLGAPTDAQRYHYTLVLKGHLALARSVFVDGTCGSHLDILARQFLWSDRLDYHHGTGHGVGSFLCVHEGPHGISQRSNVPLKPGMIVSNEPGLYLECQYGIRIENLCLVEHAGESEFGIFYKLTDLTLVPYQKKMIMFDLLDQVEMQQIQAYYLMIQQHIMQLLSPTEQAWLQSELCIS